MTKEETVAIMALLGAFYSGGKNDPKQQAQAWHMILYKYDFDVAKNAVLKFAENDVRDYATFPAVGKIVEAIRNEQHLRSKPVNDIIKAISYGKGYEALDDTCKGIISEEQYKEWLAVDAMEFATNSQSYADALRKGQKWLR